MADSHHGAGVADQKSCTGARSPQKPRRQRHLREDLGRLPDYTKGPASRTLTISAPNPGDVPAVLSPVASICSAIIRLLLLLLSPFILNFTELAESKKKKKSRIYKSIASIVKFSVIMFRFVCPRESKIPLHDKNFITALNQQQPENSMAQQSQRGRAVNNAHFVFLF